MSIDRRRVFTHVLVAIIGHSQPGPGFIAIGDQVVIFVLFSFELAAILGRIRRESLPPIDPVNRLHWAMPVPDGSIGARRTVPMPLLAQALCCMRIGPQAGKEVLGLGCAQGQRVVQGGLPAVAEAHPSN